MIMFGLRLVLLAVAVPMVLGYDEIYDKLDVDKILNDDGLFTAYINCLLDKGECKVEHSADFRKIVPEVIATACAKCSLIQRNNMRKTVKALQEKRPDDFNAFRAKYDPKDEYQEEFAAFLVRSD